HTPKANQNIQLFWSGSWAWSDFEFVDYRIDDQDYSGHALTGVPRHSLTNSLQILLTERLEAWLSHQYTSAMPLNDAGTALAEASHILRAKINWEFPLPHRQSSSGLFRLHLFAGGDNLLNQTYSLGHDINAFGGRYYNAAPLRSYYAGLGLSF